MAAEPEPSSEYITIQEVPTTNEKTGDTATSTHLIRGNSENNAVTAPSVHDSTSDEDADKATRAHSHTGLHRTPHEDGTNSTSERVMKLFWPMFADFAINALLWAAFVAVVMVTKNSGVLDRREKHIFTVGIVGIPLVIGIHVVHSYKRFAAAARWRLLSREQFTAKETDLVLGIGSYLTVLTLGIRWVRSASKYTSGHYLKAFICFSWILLMLASQVSLALLGLVVEMNSEGALLYKDGYVEATKLDNFYVIDAENTGGSVPSLSDRQTLAHRYGDASHELFQAAQQKPIGTRSKPTPGYGRLSLDRVNETGWEYQFRDWTTLNNHDDVPFGMLEVQSGRYLSIDAKCKKYAFEEWNIVGIAKERLWWTLWNEDPQYTTEGEYIAAPAGSVTCFNADNNPEAPLPIGTLDLSRTLCGGNRCASVGIFMMDKIDPNYPEGNGTFFECNVTVSDVKYNTGARHVHGAQVMPDLVAKLVAGAMALDGYVGENNTNHRLDTTFTPRFQWMTFRDKTLWGKQLLRATSETEVASIVSGFTAGVIAGLDGANPRNGIMGRKVLIGVRLVIRGDYIWLIMALYLGSYLVLMLWTIWYSCHVKQRDDSYLSHAIYLHPIIESFVKADGGDTKRLMEVKEWPDVKGVRWRYDTKRHVLRSTGRDPLEVESGSAGGGKM